MSSIVNQGLLTVKQAAERLQLSRSKLYGMTSRREIGFYKLGGKILFAESDILKFLAKSRVEPAEPKAPPVKLKHLTLN